MQCSPKKGWKSSINRMKNSFIQMRGGVKGAWVRDTWQRRGYDETCQWWSLWGKSDLLPLPPKYHAPHIQLLIHPSIHPSSISHVDLSSTQWWMNDMHSSTCACPHPVFYLIPFLASSLRCALLRGFMVLCPSWIDRRLPALICLVRKYEFIGILFGPSELWNSIVGYGRMSCTVICVDSMQHCVDFSRVASVLCLCTQR